MLAFLGFVGCLLVVPGPFIRTDALADAGVVIAERDGREIAVTVYRASGASLLAELADDGGRRIIAIDLETGDTVWDERIHETENVDAFLDDRQLIGASDAYVFLRTTFDVYVFSLEDGSLIATKEDIPHLTEATGALDRLVHPEGTDEILFMDGGADVLRVLDMNTLEVQDADPTTASTWFCVLDRMQYTYEDETASNASRPAWSTTETFGDSIPSNSAVLGRSVLADPLPDACAAAGDDEDVFPEGKTTTEVLGDERALLLSDAGVTPFMLQVFDVSTGEILDASPETLTTRSAAAGSDGRFAVVADRDLTGIAPDLFREVHSSVVYVVDSTGRVHETILGTHGWFGMPW